MTSGGFGARRRPVAQDAGEDRAQALALLDAVAGAPAQRSLMSRRRKREGFRSRAAYKLIEIDEKYQLLKPGQRIVDLGAAPGGWCQVAARAVGSHEGQGQGDRHRPSGDRRRSPASSSGRWISTIPTRPSA